MADKFKDIPTTFREDEIAKEQAQVGTVENLKLGHEQTAIFAAARKVEDEKQGNIQRNIDAGLSATKVAYEKLPLDKDAGPIEKTARDVLIQGAMKVDYNVATAQSLINRTGEGDDPDYNKMDHIDTLLEGIPRKYHNDIMANNSLTAASRARGRVLEDLASQEVLAMQDFGGLARFSTSLVDADLPLVFASGGAFGAAKISAKTIKAASMVGIGVKGQKVLSAGAVGASGGAQSGFAVGVANLGWREGSGVSDVVNYTVLGTLGGAALMATSKGAGQLITSSLPKRTDIQPSILPDDALDPHKAFVETSNEPFNVFDGDIAATLPDSVKSAVMERRTKSVQAIQDEVLRSPNLPEILKEVDALGLGTLTKVGQGNEGIVYTVSNNSDIVVRLSPIARGYSNHPAELRAISETRIGDITLSVLPKADTNVSKADYDVFVDDLFASHGIEMADPGIRNVGYVNGELVVIDGGLKKFNVEGDREPMTVFTPPSRPTLPEVTGSEIKGRASLMSIGETVNGSLLKLADDYADRVSTNDPSLHVDPYIADGPPRPDTVYAKGETVTFTGVGSEGLELPEGLTPVDFTGSVENLTPEHQALVNRAHRANYDANFYAQRDKDAQKIIQKLSNSKWAGVTGTGAQGKWYKSKSPLLNHVGQTFFENGSGYLRGKNTSGILDAKYTARIQTQLDGARAAAYDFAKTSGDTIAFGQGINNTGLAKFHRGVLIERNRRSFGRQGTDDPNIRLGADSYDNAAKEALTIGRGRDGETSIDGFQSLPDNPHYTPTKWGRKLGAIIRNAEDSKAMKAAMVRGIAQSYRDAGMAAGKDAESVARAVVSRSMSSDAGIDTSLVGLLQGDGREVLRDALLQENMSAGKVEGLMKRLVGSMEDRSKAGFAKSKNDLDLETTFDLPDGSQMQIVDLISNDLHMDWHRYTRTLAGSAALARNGVTNGAERSALIDSILTEQRRLGEDGFSKGELEALFSVYDGGALKGHHWGMGDQTQEQGAVVATAKRAVNLAYLGKLGMTQLGETGGTIVQHGLANWAARGVMPAFNKELRNSNKKLLQEAAYLTGNIGKDQHYLAPHMNLDELSAIDGATLSGKLQGYMADASFVQGYTSFFNTVRTWQQQTAALGVMDSVIREVQKDMADGLSEKLLLRLWGDFGIDAEDVTRISEMIADGKVKFKTTGGITFVDELGLTEWDQELAETFTSAIVRNTNATVQRAMAGEQDAWMSTQLGGLFSHLKTFPMQATQKQFARHFRHNDGKAYAAVGYTFATAYAASLIRGAMDGRDMSVEDHAKRAFSYSNMTGFIPMAYDPLMTVLGMEDKRFSQFAPHSDITPPALGFANDALRLPGALGKAALGQADGSDRSAIRTLPFSNTILYGEMINGIASRNRDK